MTAAGRTTGGDGGADATGRIDADVARGAEATAGGGTGGDAARGAEATGTGETGG